jgi:hypothetical protein
MTCGRDSPTMCQTRPSLSSRDALGLGLAAAYADGFAAPECQASVRRTRKR